MFHRNRSALSFHTAHAAKRLAQLFSRQNALRADRTMGPTLVALVFANAAHAQGTMDFTGATTLMTTFNNRLAYVSLSRASDDARIYTNHAESLGERLASDVTKTTAIDVSKLYRLSDVGGASSRSTPDVEFEGFGIAL